MNYEKLLIKAENLDITVKEIELKEHGGLCIGDVIFIDKNLDDTSKYCVLAEELGHYRLTVGNITDQSKITNRKQEIVARRWGFENLVRILDIIKAYEAGTKNRYEMAQFIGVTERFLDESIKYYKAKYGTCFTIDNYTIYFEPNLGVVKMF
ncbi:ImmA/IrrE family metallo-endopeptidase [Clostridium botulinum]|nr:ImmA/IrrE family metallo-endopeptidase [Clostridium botulinum]